MAVSLSLQARTISAQDAAIPDARSLRSALQKELLAALMPEKKAYRDQLVAMEKRFAAEQDFANAIRVRNERLALEKELAGIEKEMAKLQTTPAAVESTHIELKCATAKSFGVQLDAAKGCLTGWDAPDAAAVWTLPDLPPGGYEVVLNCAGGGGAVTLKESFYTLQGTLKPAKGDPVDQHVGTLRIRDGKGPLTLKVNSPEQSKALRVYSIVLLPSAR